MSHYLKFCNDDDFNKDFASSKANYNDWTIAANAFIVDTLGRKPYSITIAELNKYKFSKKKTIANKHCFFMEKE